MLDTHGRKYVDPYFDKTADFLIKKSLTPNKVTLVALFAGVGGSLVYYMDYSLFALGLLWFSGYLDAVDGAMARKSQAMAKVGTLLDIFFDRVVEVSFLIAFGFRFPEALPMLLLLSCSFILSMTVFLASGMLLENTGKKTFYYQAGLMERTEGFIMFTLMILFGSQMAYLAGAYALLVVFTVFQRLFESMKALEEKDE